MKLQKKYVDGDINALYLEGDIQQLNLNTLVEQKMQSVEAVQIMEYLADEYSKLFGEDIA